MSTVDERYQQGKALRKEIPRSTHASFARSPDVDPVDVLLSQEGGRIASLIPVRHARMGEDAFAFYRAGAKLMATDLSGTPTTQLIVQASGDAHLSNFGWYGSPERNIVFDTNDFDETLPASFEWDVKRLAASFVIAARHNAFDAKDQEAVALRAVQSYRDAMLQFASRGFLDVWYAHVSAERALQALKDEGKEKWAKRLEKGAEKARRKDSRHVLAKLTERVDGRNRIIDDRPWVVPIDKMVPDMRPEQIMERVTFILDNYANTVPDDRRVLLERYTLADAALKVVGVGSVGTRCYIALLEGRDENDPLFLQLKEAGPSVLSEFYPPSEYAHHGERVVRGQQLMQTVTDIFLGWTTGLDGRCYYVRQLKDMKASAEIDDFGPKRLSRYARLCGATLANAHARSGDPAAIAGYMGTGEVFADAITGFAVTYADQNQADFDAFGARVGFETDDES